MACSLGARACRTLLAISVGIGMFCFGDDANAQRKRREKPGETTFVPAPRHDNYYLDTYFWSASQVHTFSFVLGGKSMVWDNFAVDFDVPFSFTVLTDETAVALDTKAIAAVGNPTLGLRYVSPANQPFTWTVGGGLGAPMASIEDERGLYRLAGLLGYSATAYNAHYWVPDAIPFFAMFDAEYQLAPLYLRGSFKPLFFVPIDASFTGIGTQERIEAEAKAGNGVGGGIGLQAVTALTDAEDGAQVSIEAYFTYDDPEVFFMRVGPLLALDEPLGVGFDEGKVLTGHLLLGGYTDSDQP